MGYELRNVSGHAVYTRWAKPVPDGYVETLAGYFGKDAALEEELFERLKDDINIMIMKVESQNSEPVANVEETEAPVVEEKRRGRPRRS